MPSWEKDPDAELDWKIDWGSKGWLGATETIQTSTWIVPAGLTKVSDTHDDTTATIWLTGGTAGVVYTVTNRVATSADRIDDRSIVISVIDR